MEKKIETINELIRVYDENEKLKRELEKLNAGESTPKEEINPYLSLIDMGRKKIFGEVFYNNWNYPSVLVDLESKQLVFLEFEQWLAMVRTNVINVTNRTDYLNCYSLEQLKDYFREELEEVFNNHKQEIIEKSKEKEGE